MSVVVVLVRRWVEWMEVMFVVAPEAEVKAGRSFPVVDVRGGWGPSWPREGRSQWQRSTFSASESIPILERKGAIGQDRGIIIHAKLCAQDCILFRVQTISDSFKFSSAQVFRWQLRCCNTQTRVDVAMVLR